MSTHDQRPSIAFRAPHRMGQDTNPGNPFTAGKPKCALDHSRVRELIRYA